MQRERTPQSPTVSRKQLPVLPKKPAFHVDQSHVVAFTLGVLVTQLPRYVGLIAVCIAVYFLVGFDRKQPEHEAPKSPTVSLASSRRPSATKAATPPVAPKSVAKLDRISHERRVLENARQPSIDRNYAFRPYGS